MLSVTRGLTCPTKLNLSQMKMWMPTSVVLPKSWKRLFWREKLANRRNFLAAISEKPIHKNQISKASLKTCSLKRSISLHACSMNVRAAGGFLLKKTLKRPGWKAMYQKERVEESCNHTAN